MAATPPDLRWKLSTPEGAPTEVERYFQAETHTLRRVLGKPATLEITTSDDVTNLLEDFAVGCVLEAFRGIGDGLDGPCLWRGDVGEIPIRFDNAPNKATLAGADRLADLDNQMALRNGNAIYSYQSPVADLTAIALVNLADTAAHADDVLYPLYPAFASATDAPSSSSPWVARDNSRSTTITDAIADDITTDPIPVADYRQIKAPCFVQIESELLYVRLAYPATPITTGSTAGFMDGITRGALGSTAAAHADNSTAYWRKLKPASDTTEAVLTHNGGVLIETANYNHRLTEGRFDFMVDPSGFTSPVAAYSVFDIDKAGAWTPDLTGGALLLSDVIGLELAEDDPGPGSAAVDVSGLEDIPVARQANNEPAFIGPVIQRQLDDWASDAEPGTVALVVDYHPEDDGYRVYSVTQKTTPDFIFEQEMQRLGGTTVDNLHNRVFVSYISNERRNLLSTERVFHPSVGDQIDDATPSHTNTATVDKIIFWEEAQSGIPEYQTDTTAGNNQHTAGLFNEPDMPFTNQGGCTQGWGMEISGPFDGEYVLFAWLETPGIVGTVGFTANLQNYVEGLYLVQVVGLDTYVPGDPPSIGAEVGLGVSVSDVGSDYEADPDKRGETNRDDFAFDLNVECAAIAIKVTGGSLEALGDTAQRILIGELFAEGIASANRTVVVSVVNDTPTDATEYLSPAIYSRLGDKPVVHMLNAGECTELEAIRAGRQYLDQEHGLATARTFVIESDMPAGQLPMPGETVQIGQTGQSGAFIGVCHELVHRVSGAREVLELKLVDHRTTG